MTVHAPGNVFIKFEIPEDLKDRFQRQCTTDGVKMALCMRLMVEEYVRQGDELPAAELS
jgi:hypothetical protein